MSTPVITGIYAFVSVQDDGTEGIVAVILPGLGTTPAVTGSALAANRMVPLIQDVQKATGVKIKCLYFTQRTNVSKEVGLDG